MVNMGCRLNDRCSEAGVNLKYRIDRIEQAMNLSISEPHTPHFKGLKRDIGQLFSIISRSGY